MNGISRFSCTLNDLPFSFVYKDKKMVLRTITLGSDDHFNCVVRCLDSWLQCDGMRQTPRRIKLYPLNQDNYEFMEGYSLNFVLYEVVDSAIEHDFGDPNFDFSTAICTDQNNDITPDLIALGLSQTSKEASALHKKFKRRRRRRQKKAKIKKLKRAKQSSVQPVESQKDFLFELKIKQEEHDLFAKAVGKRLNMRTYVFKTVIWQKIIIST